jgi:hypothetical protein
LINPYKIGDRVIIKEAKIRTLDGDILEVKDTNAVVTSIYDDITVGVRSKRQYMFVKIRCLTKR